MIILLKTGEYEVGPEEMRNLRARFPKLDVPQQLSNMAAWCEANPAKRKTKRGVNRFIVNWLIKTSEKAPGYVHAASHKPLEKGIPRTTESDKHAALDHMARLQTIIDKRKQA
mgnify:CR=1 FL=1